MNELAAEARRLRMEEGLSGRQIQHRLGVPKQRLQDWLRGVPPPEWTRRPNAKDDLRAQAVALRQEGWSVNDIALDLGVARSTAWNWVRHLPLDRDSERARRKREHSRTMTDARWQRHREDREALRSEVRSRAAHLVREVSRRDLLLVGAALYWCEGAKQKEWRHFGSLTFTNSDPRLVALYLAFLRALDVPSTDIRFRLYIHESADAAAALGWWSALVGVPASGFQPTSFKRHNPRTARHNVGPAYRGCLAVTVRRGQQLYWQIEAVVDALVTGVT